MLLAALIVALVPRFALSPTGADIGRYQNVHGGGHVFVLGTKTGRYWQRYVSPGSGPTEWDEGRGPWAGAIK